jgi:RimJ/RimL family protein N-acetyltransferase
MSAHPILIEFAEQFETERLIIRSPLWGDGAMVNAAIRESIEELRPWMPWAQQIPTVEQSEENVRHARIKFLERADMRLHIFHKATGEFIGASGLHRIDWVVKKFEIGYWIRTSQSGKGLMTEAVEGVTNFAINQLFANRLEIRCDANNIRSMRIAERLGFILEGILRSDTISVTGNLRDTMVFAKIRGQEF